MALAGRAKQRRSPVARNSGARRSRETMAARVV